MSGQPTRHEFESLVAEFARIQTPREWSLQGLNSGEFSYVGLPPVPLLACPAVRSGYPVSTAGQSQPSHPKRARLVATLVLGLLLTTSLASADTITLRSGERVDDRTVTAVDEDGLQLDQPLTTGTKTIRLDEVQSAKVAADKQPVLDKLLEELGDPLFRLRWRLSVGDVDGLHEPAETVYARYRGRRSPTALLVATATMRGRIQASKRESAVEPLLQIVEILRSGGAKPSDLPGEARLSVDPARGTSSELAPVWFDAAAAKAALPDVLATIRTMAQPRPDGVRIYYGSLAAAAGDEATAKSMLDDLQPQDPLLQQLLVAVQALRPPSQADGSAVAKLTTLADENKLLPAAESIALYAVGLARIASTDAETVRDGVLDLLKIPALHARHDRELAAAALYQSAAALSKLKEEGGATAVRRELRTRFGESWHAEQLK